MARSLGSAAPDHRIPYGGMTASRKRLACGHRPRRCCDLPVVFFEPRPILDGCLRIVKLQFVGKIMVTLAIGA